MRDCRVPWSCLAMIAALGLGTQARSQQQVEQLDRGVVALARADGAVYVGWRLLESDLPGVGFHVYRTSGSGATVRLTEAPIERTTDLVDRGADLSEAVAYHVRAVRDDREGPASCESRLTGSDATAPYRSIPLRTLDGHRPNDASCGDLDGDGQYEIVVKQEMRPRDNSQAGETGQTKLEAYTLDGTFLWRIDLGPNIREGAHYTPFIVYDLDGDGRAEVACRTADGTRDGQGGVLGDPDANHRNSRGYVLEGPERLTIFEGRTGRALASMPYEPPRGEVSRWGDDHGNRVDRFLACVAYLDGERPSLVACRGYYTRTVLAAWNWRAGVLERVWTFDSDDGQPGHDAYRGQGNHGLSVADVDGDGRDEILYGACEIDDDGRGLHSTGLGHGDAMHVADLDPERPGLEVLGIHERPRHPHGLNLRDARTGEILWSRPSRDVARGLALDIDPRYHGSECWALGDGLDTLLDCQGARIGPRPRSCNMGIYWDADPQRELLDGTRIDDWDAPAGRSIRLLSAEELGCASNNGSKASPCLVADLLGDWREEVVWRTEDNRELRLFSTTIPSDFRRPTLMHDRLYRLGIAWQNVGYNQPPHLGAPVVVPETSAP